VPITGTVNEYREALISLTLRGIIGREVGIEAIIDTGFDDYLTLPAERLAELALPARDFVQIMLADGSTAQTALYEAEVLWDGEWRAIVVQMAASMPLIGTALLEGYRVTLDMTAGGPVTIEPLDEPTP
jgi:clan AA aspartic protease